MKYRTATIQHSELKPHIKKGVKKEGMYFLEKILGECRGHGTCFAGGGGEDISFDLPKIKAIVNLNDNGRRIKIEESDDLYNQKGVEVDCKSVDIRPGTLKHLKFRLCV